MRRLEGSPLETAALSQEDADYLYRLYPSLAHNHLHGCPACGKNRGVGVDGVVTLADGEWCCNCRDQLQRHKHYLNAGIGSTYQFLSWRDYHGDMNAARRVQNEYLDHLDVKVESGEGFILSSEQYGNGKTFMASQVAKTCVIMGYDTYFTTFPDMLSNMKAGWKDAEFEKWYRCKVDAAQVLFLDDVGKELMGGSGFNNDFARQTLDTLLRSRAQQGRVTIITTNLASDTFSSTYSPAIWSLLKERDSFIRVNGDDFRSHTVALTKGQRRVW